MFSFLKENDVIKIGLIGGGLFALGYQLGKRNSRDVVKKEFDGRSLVSKSYYTEGSGNVVLKYCLNHTTPLHPVQNKLISETLVHPRSGMMGAPEVVCLNAALIKMSGAKKVLDIGVYTGASSLAAALALPSDGVVIACDVSEEFTNIARKYWLEAGVDHKVKLVIDQATNTLDKLIANGEENTFDFAFIDADKTGYDSYYERCLKLLKPGGVIAIDNTLWHGQVLPEANANDVDTVALKTLNDKIARDSGRVFAVQMNIGDGYTLAVKL